MTTVGPKFGRQPRWTDCKPDIRLVIGSGARRAFLARQLAMNPDRPSSLRTGLWPALPLTAMGRIASPRPLRPIQKPRAATAGVLRGDLPALRHSLGMWAVMPPKDSALLVDFRC